MKKSFRQPWREHMPEGNCLFCLIDDIILATESEESHYKMIEVVFHICTQCGTTGWRWSLESVLHAATVWNMLESWHQHQSRRLIAWKRVLIILRTTNQWFRSTFVHLCGLKGGSHSSRTHVKREQKRDFVEKPESDASAFPNFWQAIALMQQQGYNQLIFSGGGKIIATCFYT